VNISFLEGLLPKSNSLGNARGKSLLADDFTLFRDGLSPASRLLQPAKTLRAVWATGLEPWTPSGLPNRSKSGG